MLCASVCPSNGFDFHGKDFFPVITRLKNIESPVLGCSRFPELDANERVSCLGFLSEEHFAVLLVLLENPLQLNLTECAQCTNGFIADVLRKRLLEAEAKTFNAGSDKIKLVEQKAELLYQDVSYKRRAFFKVLKNIAAEGASNFLDYTDINETHQAYSDKSLPDKRELLNRAWSVLSSTKSEWKLNNYYFYLFIDNNCDYCFACVGMCPTGALTIEKNDTKKQLFFNSFRCTGCRLCTAFCMKNAITVTNGKSTYHIESNPFHGKGNVKE
jgi:ferredoxin